MAGSETAGSPPGGEQDPHPHDRLDVEVECLVRALRSYGILTEDRLAELAGAEHWSGPRWHHALRQAQAEERIRRRGDHFYELTERELGP